MTRADLTQRENAVREAIARLGGPTGADLEVTMELDPADESWTISTSDAGALRISASSVVAGVSAYTRYTRLTGAGAVSRYGTRAASPMRSLQQQTTAVTRYPHRVAYNLTVAGYTDPYADWASWERELDLLAASGVNRAHLTLGQEAVWMETFTRFGYTEDEVLAWIVPPSHQAWQWLNNVQYMSGGVSRRLVEHRVDLGRRVLARMRELGISPILPGFSGSVPRDFDVRNAGAEIVPQGLWFMDVAGPQRPDWLRSDGAEYAAVADRFYAAQAELFDGASMWAVDLLHEGGRVGGASIADATRGVEAAMRRANPEYVWFAQAWAANPREEFLRAADSSHLVVLDLTGEGWNRESGFSGVPYVHGILPNFGGRHGLYGDLAAIAAIPDSLAQRGEDQPIGLTNMAEGVSNNPVVWDLFSDMTWTSTSIDLDTWLDDWVVSRYGSSHDGARRAWSLLRDTAYSTWRASSSGPPSSESFLARTGQPVDAAVPMVMSSSTPLPMSDDSAKEFEMFEYYAGTDSIIAAVPSLRATQASTVGPGALPYEDLALLPALRLLVDAGEELPATPAYAYDLVDIGRQVIDDLARVVLRAVETAHGDDDLERYDASVGEFLELIELQERLLATQEDFLLGRWLRQVAQSAGDDEEERRLANDVRRLITTWGYADSAMLMEYANRNWAGVVGDYYGARWRLWFGEVRRAMRGEKTTPIDWYGFGAAWAETHTPVISEPQGDSLLVAADVVAAAERIWESATSVER
ncbi:alpha-N-acetylglucosaminidase TIM-barrel domain-containing protein [Microbacterium phyllosphaerae]|uniref:alpha-N-acetylglucosaminidase n=1 Tax=Microbacterium phyllosphaerae TaxID=124798 RepID=UPI003D6565B5